MARDRATSIAIAAGVVLTAALALVANVITDHSSFHAWVTSQHWSLATLLKAFLVILGGIVAITVYQEKKRAAEVPAASSAAEAPLDPALRLRLLDRVQHDRVDARLNQGLRQALRVDLDLTEMPDAVAPKLRVYTTSESGPSAEREIDEPLQEVFEKTAGRRLLILGDPGTGKTNCLLELAGSLIREAKRDAALPIPVVFSLPRWTLGKKVRTLDEWLVDDLVSEYGVSRATAAPLVAQKRILPLLDGLDEVSEQRRGACIQAINAFQGESDLGGLAVCCRTQEYAELTRIDLATAVRVEKLSRAAVEREIARPRMQAVRDALDQDPQLWEIIDTPLWLHVLFGAAQVQPPAGEPSSDPKRRLYARYVDYAIGREAEGSPRRRTARERLLHYVGWLASEMRERGQSVFALEDLDASWLPLRGQPRWVKWTGILSLYLIGCEVGLGFPTAGLVWLAGGTALGIRFFLFLALAFGLLSGILALNGDREEPTDQLAFSLRSGQEGLGVTALIVVATSAVVWWLGHSLALAVLVAVLASVGCFALDALEVRPIGERKEPNSGTMRTMRFVAIGVGAAAALSALVRGVSRLHVLSGHFARAMMFDIALGIAMLAFFKGGVFLVQNYSARLVLGLFRKLPFFATRFFSEAAERLFLVRRGGGYEFLHSTFRGFMAESYGVKDSVTVGLQPVQESDPII